MSKSWSMYLGFALATGVLALATLVVVCWSGPRTGPVMATRTLEVPGLSLRVPGRGPGARPATAAWTVSDPGLRFDSPGATHVRLPSDRAAAGEPPDIEVTVRTAPAIPALAAVLALERGVRFGPRYRARDSRVVRLPSGPHADHAGAPGHDWLRTRFSYDPDPAAAGARRTVHASEYAIAQGDRLYRVTFWGRPGEPAASVAERHDALASSLRLTSPTSGRAFTNADQPAAQVPVPDAVARSALAVVMVLAADVRDGRVEVVAQGSGIVVSADGAVLGSLHVLYDESAHELHDLFFIGRVRGPDGLPAFACLGRPDPAALDEPHDLALLRCERDLEDRARAADWSFMTPAGDAWDEPDTVYVLGFADDRGGRLAITRGPLDRHERGARDPDSSVIRTRARVDPGMSGGAAVDARGRLVGVASAYRWRVHMPGARDPGPPGTHVERIGLIRPLARTRVREWLARSRDPAMP